MANGETYEIEVRHDGLHKFRVIRGKDHYEVQQKAIAQQEAWDEMWERKQEKEALRQEREDKKQEAREETEEAQKELKAVSSVLDACLDLNCRGFWNSLRDEAPYPVPKPQKLAKLSAPRAPRPEDRVFRPLLKWWDRIIPEWRERKEAEAHERFLMARSRWERQIQELKAQAATIVQEHRDALRAWGQARDKYLEVQAQKNAKVDAFRARYKRHESTAVVEYCQTLLSRLEQLECVQKNTDFDYVSESKSLIIDFEFPDLNGIPTLKEVRYVQSRDDFKEMYLQKKEVNQLYDSLLYQTCLGMVHLLFKYDSTEAVKAIVFNGWVHATDKRTGQETDNCILSLHTTKEEFGEVNLEKVDPKECFRALKGVAAAQLHGLTPVAPIMQINREDKRFVAGQEVADQLDDSTNLASMHWEDFEHLIRQLFEQEFSGDGSEVQVTRASRDGGVDAVVFDPDPLRGGKIVIQAKRYTNTVGVAAVRDLYGTLLNEGATKGILVTTSAFGSDAYKFSKDKPISLLDGSNLLHLLARHGHRAKIDLVEAKKLLGDETEDSR
jgi:restriction system protein